MLFVSIWLCCNIQTSSRLQVKYVCIGNLEQEQVLPSLPVTHAIFLIRNSTSFSFYLLAKAISTPYLVLGEC